MRLTTHQLAKLLLTLEDVPVVVGRSADIYQCGMTELQLTEKGHVVFQSDKKHSADREERVFWMSGPLI